MRPGVRAATRTREGPAISIRALVTGIVACAALALAAAAVLGLVMSRTLLPEPLLPTIMGAVNLVALVCGGYLAGRRADAMGWLNGGLAGLAYTILVVVLGAFFFPGPAAVLLVLRRVAVAFLLGALGGTIGINT